MVKKVFTSFSAMPRSLPAQSIEINELKALAAQAFETLSPATKKRFVDAAGKHPPGPFDSSWAAKTATELVTGGGGSSPDELIICLMAYLKDAAKEKRENQDFKREAANQTLRAIAANAKAQTRAIDQGQQEASERFDSAMSAAEREMWVGLMSVLSAALHTGIGSLSAKPAKVDDKSLQQAVIRKLRAQLAKMRTSAL